MIAPLPPAPIGMEGARAAGPVGPCELPVGLEAYGPLLRRLEHGTAVEEEHSALLDEALAVWARPGFDIFMCLPRLRFEPFDYQLEAAGRVLRHMQGRAILADEVGLGKTIEAGLVLSELRLRGLAGRVLVLAPAGLVGQWQEELERKFALPSVAATAGWEPPAGAGPHPIVVASLPAARREPQRSKLVAAGWDLVIADEAHRLKSPGSASARLARGLRARYLLLLTATPVENRLADLFQLVSLARPGSLGSANEFRARHGAGEGVAARNVGALRLALTEVMVRHRRSELTAMLPQRLAETVCVAPGAEEAELYRRSPRACARRARGAGPAQALALRSVQRLAGSSPQALGPSLAKLRWEDLAACAHALPVPAKALRLAELLRQQVDRGEKVVVFTGFRRTLEQLERLVAARGLEAVELPRQPPPCREGRRDRLPSGTRCRSCSSTEAAGEGRNLQFCRVMVNFDLPWNPMQIEQRLGRIHRIGQERDVFVTNLVARDTIEERLLHVLQTKINLFELVVGELDMILGRIRDDLQFEALVFEEHVTSRDDSEFASRLEALGDDLARARKGYLESRARTDELVETA